MRAAGRSGCGRHGNRRDCRGNFKYERTQSRIGRSLYEAPYKYIENSPIFHIDRVSTPLLMLHDDNDDAVPCQKTIAGAAGR